MVDTPKLALLAFLLREAAAAPFTDAQWHLEELVTDSPELNLAMLAAGSYFGEAEWALCKLLAQTPPGWVVVSTAGDLQAQRAPVLAEALLHASGPNGKRTRAEWAQPYMERWWQVRSAINAYQAEGIADAFGTLAEEADEAYMAHNDIDLSELLTRYPRRRPEPVPACARNLLWDG